MEFRARCTGWSTNNHTSEQRVTEIVAAANEKRKKNETMMVEMCESVHCTV